MKFYRATILLSALCAQVASCSPQNNSLLVVSVDGPDTIAPVYYMRVVLNNGGEQDYHQFPTNGSGTRVTLPASLGFNLARSRQGEIALSVDALDMQMNVVANGKGSVTLKVGERVDLCVGLTPSSSSCLSTSIDGGTSVSDGSNATSDLVSGGGSDVRIDQSGGLPAGLLLSHVAAGADHSCAVAVDGSLWCWGANATGQLGNGGSINAALPLRVAGSLWSDVAAGYGETCGLQSTGDLWCWGNNGSGQLGNGSAKSGSFVAIPLQVPGAGWTGVSLGEYHVCGMQQDGTLWTWGDNSSDQLGDSAAPSAGRSSPGAVGSSPWFAVGAGSLHNCAIQTDRTLWCWGNNADGQLGDGTTHMRVNPTQVLGADWASVSAGLYHTCATKTDGSLWCWGDNSNGQLGVVTSAPSPSPVQVTAGAATWLSVTTGQSHTCGLHSDKSLWCWGGNADGQLGIASNLPASIPTAVAPGTLWKVASAGGSHSCAIADDGTLWCWGRNANGQLGIGGQTPQTAPVRLGK